MKMDDKSNFIFRALRANHTPRPICIVRASDTLFWAYYGTGSYLSCHDLVKKWYPKAPDWTDNVIRYEDGMVGLRFSG